MKKPVGELLSVLTILLLVIAVSLLLFAPLFFGETKYKIGRVVRLDGIASNDQNLAETIDGAKQFSENLINEYLDIVRREVHRRFWEDFRLLKPQALGVKVIISNFAESLLYIYPAHENELVVDSIDIPI